MKWRAAIPIDTWAWLAFGLLSSHAFSIGLTIIRRPKIRVETRHLGHHKMVNSIVSYSYYPTNATLASTELHTIHCILARYRQEVHASRGERGWPWHRSSVAQYHRVSLHTRSTRNTTRQQTALCCYSDKSAVIGTFNARAIFSILSMLTFRSRRSMSPM